MASSTCFSLFCSFNSTNKPAFITGNSLPPKVIRINEMLQSSKPSQFQTMEVKAANSEPSSTKRNSIVCSNCEGNGAVQCSQCKGTGVNIVDHFNGQFKAGALCWLCRGKREMLCGDCNGAGFLGGFMSTFDE